MSQDIVMFFKMAFFILLILAFIILCYNAEKVSLFFGKVSASLKRLFLSLRKDHNGFTVAPGLGNNVSMNKRIDIICQNVQPLPAEFSFSEEQKRALVNSQFNRISITQATGCALRHLGLNPAYYHVDVIYDWEGNEKKAGTYKSFGAVKTITIIVQKGMECEQVLATVCHECTHAFLYSRNIKVEPEPENEKLTDCAAVMLGFGKILLEGYQSFTRTEWGITSHREITSKVGYIDTDQIEYALRARENFLLQKEYDEQKEEYIDGIWKEITQLREVLERYEYVVKELAADKTVKPSEEDCRLLSGEIFNLSNGHYWEQKDKLETEFQHAVKKSEYEEVRKKAAKLGGDLTLITVRLGKYL